jgi:hypothetical protein
VTKHVPPMPGRVMAGYRHVRASVAQFGIPNALLDLALKATNTVVLLKVIKGLMVERVDPTFLECPTPYRPMFLDEPLLREFSKEPDHELAPSFVDDALAKGDECYGILVGDQLASYGWYSRRPTRIDPPALMLHFNERYIYMYKGFTDIRHRGRRLHAIGMARAMEHYLELGYKGLVAYVESNNFSSLKSVRRMGYVEFGAIGVLRIFGRYMMYASHGCRSFDFRIEPATGGAPRYARSGALLPR